MPHSNHRRATAILVCDADRISDRAALEVAAAEQRTVWYFGDDHRLFTDMRENAPADVRFGDTGARLSQIFESFEPDLINLENGFRVLDQSWWETRNIAERGPHVTSFNADCCRYLLFCELLEEPGKHLVVVERPDLRRELIRTARNKGAAIINLSGKRWLEQPTQARKGLIDVLRYVRAVLRQCRRIVLLRQGRRRYPIRIRELQKCDVLIAAWTKPGDSNVTGPRNLAHSMGLLPKMLREDGMTVGFIALPLYELATAKDIFRDVLAAHDPTLLPEDTQTVRSVFSCALRSLITGVIPKTEFKIGGHDVSGIAAMTLRREKYDWRPANASLWSSVGPFLAKHGIRPASIVHLYENQSWEKGLRIGFRKALPEARLVGCFQTPVSRLYLNIPPSPAELQGGRWPDMILCHGRSGVENLKRFGARRSDLIDSGLFRQGAFVVPWSPRARRAFPLRVLCTTGPSFQECLELALKTAMATATLDEFQVIVNFHPLTTTLFRENVERFVRTYCADHGRVTFSDEPISAILQQGVDVVVYGDTNAGFEGVTSGARTILLKRDHAPSFDKVPGAVTRSAASVADIRNMLGKLEDDRFWPDRDQVDTAMNSCFSPINTAEILKTVGHRFTPSNPKT